ncbi:MAG: hypothetical protein MI685_10830 [Chlorobiales bacterium]|nr:hypothetical protein [Chlorobiales bacterium]
MEDKEKTSQDNLPFLSEPYYKSHRAYAGVSALLLAWELIGITVTGKPLENYNISLKSPDAFPLVLVVLVLYFMFKITIEWHHCDDYRRESLPAKIDFYFSHVIGFLSILLYGVQQAIEFQVFDLITVDIQMDVLLMIVAIISFGFFVRFVRAKTRKNIFFYEKFNNGIIALLYPSVFFVLIILDFFKYVDISFASLYVYLIFMLGYFVFFVLVKRIIEKAVEGERLMSDFFNNRYKQTE